METEAASVYMCVSTMCFLHIHLNILISSSHEYRERK